MKLLAEIGRRRKIFTIPETNHPNVFNLEYISLTKHNIEENVKKMALVLNNLLTLINEFTYVCALYTIPHSSFYWTR